MHLLNKKILVFITGLILISAFAYYLAVSFKNNNDVLIDYAMRNTISGPPIIQWNLKHTGHYLLNYNGYR